jgi:RHS repeat-associated protein
MSRLAQLFSIVVGALLGTQLAHAERTTTYYHTDSLGSVVAASNQAGALLWRKEYRPFGEQLDSTSENEKIAYTGKEHDDVSRLTYFGARYYDPEIGRFLSIDPAGVDPAKPLSFNRYAYANNNPYRFIDPDGWEPCDLEECKDYQIRTQGRDARGAGMVRNGGEGLADVVDKEASDPLNWAGGGGVRKAEKLGAGRMVSQTIARIWRYPKVIDPRSGRPIHFPTGNLATVDKADRAPWGLEERANYIREWYVRGYATPRGGWDKYDIHHIHPRKLGGGNDFSNLVPVEKGTHREQFNKFWREYSE